MLRCCVVLLLPMNLCSFWLLSGLETRSNWFSFEPAFFQFIAENVLCGWSEVVDLVGEFFDFDVAHFTVERGEATPFFDGI